MIETRQMTTEDFLIVMAANADMYPNSIYSQFAALDTDYKRYLANINIATGEAKSFFDDGKFIGSSGIRYVGVGEAWLATMPHIREKPFLLLREAKRFFKESRDNHNLIRVFANNGISGNFLRHLGFKVEEDTCVWTRI